MKTFNLQLNCQTWRVLWLLFWACQPPYALAGPGLLLGCPESYHHPCRYEIHRIQFDFKKSTQNRFRFHTQNTFHQPVLTNNTWIEITINRITILESNGSIDYHKKSKSWFIWFRFQERTFDFDFSKTHSNPTNFNHQKRIWDCNY